MKHFGVLYRYECKKLLSKKIVWISFSLSILMILISLFAPFLGDYYIDGKFIDTNYNMYQQEKAYARALSGRAFGRDNRCIQKDTGDTGNALYRNGRIRKICTSI